MKKVIADFFDDKAREYYDKYQKVDDIRSFIFEERKKKVLSMLKGRYARILDIGCGPGSYSRELSARCDELYGVDASEKMIALAAAKRFDNVVFSVGTVEHLRFKDGFFDAVVCVGVLEYLDDIETGIKEIARVTCPGGIAIFTAPNASSVLNKLDYLARKLLKWARAFIRIDLAGSFMNYNFKPNLLGPGSIEPVLNKNGFTVNQRIFHIFRFSPLNRMSPALSLWTAKKLNFVKNRYTAINYIVSAKKHERPA